MSMTLAQAKDWASRPIDIGSPGNTTVNDLPTHLWVDGSGKTVPVFGKETRLCKDSPPFGIGHLAIAAGTGNWSMLPGEYRAAMRESQNTSGGFIVSEQLALDFIDKLRSAMVLTRLGARIVPMQTETLRIAKVDTDPTFAVHAENSEITASDISLKSVNFTAHKVAGRVIASQELIQDSPNAAQLIEQTLIRSLAAEIDRLGLVGNGGSEPQGVTLLENVQTITGVSSMDYDDLYDGMEDILDKNAVANGYVTTPAIMTKLRKLKTNSEANHYVPTPPGISELTALVSNSVTSGDLYLADWTNVLIGTRLEIALQATDVAAGAFEKYQFQVRAIWRGDFNMSHDDTMVKISE